MIGTNKKHHSELMFVFAFCSVITAVMGFAQGVVFHVSYFNSTKFGSEQREGYILHYLDGQPDSAAQPLKWNCGLRNQVES